MSSKIINTLLFVLLAGFVGCTSISNWPEFSGFLDDYRGMYRSSEIEGLFVIKDGDKNVNDYEKFIVDAVTVQFTPNAIAYNMNENELERTVESFRRDIIAALEEKYTVVENPGAGVLRVSVAVTDILKNKGSSSSVGIIEAKFIDTQTRKRVAAVLTSDEGMILKEWAALLKDRLSYLDSETKVYQFK
jgi:hypothetical protein